MSTLNLQIHEEINQVRKNNGLRTLKYSELLEKIAKKHSMGMARINKLSHDLPVPFCERIKEELYNETAGENIQANPYPNNISNVVAVWMNSTGHRENILTSSFYEEGIGLHTDSYRKITYITQILGCGESCQRNANKHSIKEDIIQATQPRIGDYELEI